MQITVATNIAVYTDSKKLVNDKRGKNIPYSRRISGLYIVTSSWLYVLRKTNNPLYNLNKRARFSNACKIGQSGFAILNARDTRTTSHKLV